MAQVKIRRKKSKIDPPYCGVTIKRFSVSFLCTVSHKNETEMETKRRFQRSSLLEFSCFLWVRAELLISLRYMRTKRKTFYCHFCNVLIYSEHAPCEATVSKNLIHPSVACPFTQLIEQTKHVKSWSIFAPPRNNTNTVLNFSAIKSERQKRVF